MNEQAGIVANGRCDTVVLPMSIVYRGKVYMLAETARHGLILTLVKSELKGLDSGNASQAH